MKILALDPGRLHTGYALFSQGRLAYYGSFRRLQGKTKKVNSRDQEIVREVDYFLSHAAHGLQFMVIEAGALVSEIKEVEAESLLGKERKNHGFSFPLNRFLEVACREGIRVVLVNPQLVYSELNKGRSGGRFRQKIVERFPRLKLADRDAISAAAVGIYFLEKLRLNEWPRPSPQRPGL